MMRWLQLLLVGVAIATAAGCATFNDPGHLSVQTEATTPTAVAPDAVAPQAAAPGQSVTMYDVEPMQEDVVAVILEGFRSDPWQPYLNSRAPPDQIAQFSRFSRSPLLNPPSCIPQPRPARPPFNLGPVQASGSFCNALQISLVPQFSIGSSTPTYTRATTAYQEDLEGKLNAVLSGEARFQGARRVANALLATEAINGASWTSTGTPIVTAGIGDPNGGTAAFTYTNTTGGVEGRYQGITSVVGHTYAGTWSVRRRTGTGPIYLRNINNVSVDITAVVTSSWRRFNTLTTATGTTGFSYILISTLGDAVDVAFPQIEDVTGQTNQNPSEYVSVGVLSAPYHGADVDGVKYFSTLNGNTVASNVVTEATGAAINSSNAKFAVLPGNASGDFYSTPNAAANSQVGDVEFKVEAAFNDITSTANQILMGKYDTVGYHFGTFPGNNKFYLHNNGNNAQSSVTLASLGLNSGVYYWWKATRATSTGTVQFFYSADNGNTWVQIGADVSTTAGAAVPSSNALFVGNNPQQGQGFGGKIKRAQLWAGFSASGGTLAVDFNPNLSTSAQTFTAATGEVWTTNGTARIFGNTNTTYGIPAMWDSGGPYGEYADPAQTDVLGTTAAIRRTMADAGWVATNVTKGTTTGSDGTAASAATLTASAGNGTVLYTTVLGAAVRTYSALVKRVTGTGTINITGDNGVTWTPITLTSAWKQYYFTTAAAANPVIGFRIVTNTDAIAVDFNTLVAGSNKFPLPTPVNVNQAATVLQYVSAGNLPTNDFTLYGEVIWPEVQPAGNYFLFGSYVDASNYTAVLWDGTNLIARKRIAGVNTDATKALTPTANTRIKWAARFSSTSGIDIFHTGAIGTNNPTTTAAQIGTNFQIGADGNGANQPFATVSSFRIYPVALSSGNLTTMTTDAVNWLLPENWAVAANDDYFRKVANQ